MNALKTKILAGSAALAVGAAAFAALAADPVNDQPLTIQINQNGKVFVRGAKVSNVVSSTITAVTAWGSLNLTWTVNTDNKTQFSRQEGRGTLSEIAKDHIITFEGDLVTSASQLTVNAKQVRDWSVVKASINQLGVIQSIDAAAKSFVLKAEQKERGMMTVFTLDSTKYLKQNATSSFSALKAGDKVIVTGLWDKTANTVQATMVRIQVETRKTFENGVLKSVASTTVPTTIVVQFGSFEYTVRISESTAVIDKNWARASLAAFRVGDRIRAYGTADGTTIEATVVRNTSLPR